MTPKSEWMPSALWEYVVASSTPLDSVQRDLITETASAFPDSYGMQIAPEQGVLLTLLTKLVGARSAVEVGTFTGFSSIAIARGLTSGGRLLCCDVSEEWTSVARRYWDKAGVADRIDLTIAPAIETLRALPAEATVDLVFLDADKEGYIGYWEELVPRVRPGGILLADNVFSHQRVLDNPPSTSNARAIVAFNQHVAADDRVEQVLVPIGDGLTLARKL